MVEVVYLGQVANVKLVDQRQVHLGVFDIQIALEVAGIFHGQDHFLFGQVILAEDIQPVFCEFPVKS